jgi:hypothetical protein
MKEISAFLFPMKSVQYSYSENLVKSWVYVIAPASFKKSEKLFTWNGCVLYLWLV